MNVIVVNCFDTYEHRVDLIYSTLTNEGHTVKVLSSNYRHFEKIKRIDNKKDFIFFDTRPYKKNLSYQRLYSHIGISKDIFHYLDTYPNKVDLLWVLVPPNSFVKEATIYKQKHPNVYLIFDLIDLWPESITIGLLKKTLPFNYWRNLRDNNIRYADCVVTECLLYRKKLSYVLQDIKQDTLYLARTKTDYKPYLTLSDDCFRLCYLGSINNIIDIDEIKRIIVCFASRKPVELHVIGDGERKNELIAVAKSVGASVWYHGKIYNREQKQKIFDSCHYGLNVMKKDVCVGLTMKSIDYMEFGLPLINNIHGDTWDIIEQERIGFNIDNINVDTYDYNARKRTREFFEKNFTTDSFKKNLIKIIEGIV